MINKRKIGKLDLKVTEIGLGTAPLGGWPIEVSEEAASKTLETAWNQGIRYFDTAPLYGSGMSEMRVCNFLQNKKDLKVNLSTGKKHSVIDVIKMTNKISGKQINYEIAKRRLGDPAELYASSDLASEALHWKPKYSDLKTLIESTWNVYNK